MQDVQSALWILIRVSRYTISPYFKADILLVSQSKSKNGSDIYYRLGTSVEDPDPGSAYFCGSGSTDAKCLKMKIISTKKLSMRIFKYK